LICVVDASVVLKWFLPEPDNAAADVLLEMLLNNKAELLAPDLLLVETANALWKRVVLRQELTAEEATRVYRDLFTLPISFTAAGDLADNALQLAMAHRHSVYDSLYCALAVEKRCNLLTADISLVKKFQQVFPFVHHLSSIVK
jgi:predicted nucleic acid-binding protein